MLALQRSVTQKHLSAVSRIYLAVQSVTQSIIGLFEEVSVVRDLARQRMEAARIR